MLERCKLVLRISTDAFDEEIGGLIDAATKDMIESGIASEKAHDTTDALIVRAVLTYVKAYFGWSNPDAPQLQESYQAQLKKLSLIPEYRGDADAV